MLVFVCLQPLSRSAVVGEESCADRVRPSVSAAWRLAVSRWRGRAPRSSLDQHPPRGPSAPRRRLREEIKLVSPRRFTAVDMETDSGSVRISGWNRTRAGHRKARFHSGKWKVTQKTLLAIRSYPWCLGQRFSPPYYFATYCISRARAWIVKNTITTLNNTITPFSLGLWYCRNLSLLNKCLCTCKTVRLHTGCRLQSVVEHSDALSWMLTLACQHARSELQVFVRCDVYSVHPRSVVC